MSNGSESNIVQTCVAKLTHTCRPVVIKVSPTIGLSPRRLATANSASYANIQPDRQTDRQRDSQTDNVEHSTNKQTDIAISLYAL